VLLLRPKLDIRYRLSGARQLNIDRDPMHPDNGWSPYAADLTIIEVPGNHDSMVLEPNVRVLSGHLRRALNTQAVRTAAAAISNDAMPTAAE
jgi:thioesterase domain-containing protein